MNENDLKDIIRIISDTYKIELRVALPIVTNGFTMEARELVDGVKIDYSIAVNLPNWHMMRGEEVFIEASKTLLPTRQAKIAAIKRWCKKQQK